MVIIVTASGTILDELLGGSFRSAAFIFAHPDDVVLSSSVVFRDYSGAALDVVVCAGLWDHPTVGSWDRESGFTTADEARKVRLAEHGRVRDAVLAEGVDLAMFDQQYLDEVHSELPARIETIARVKELTSLVARAGSAVLITHRRDALHPDHRFTAMVADLVSRNLKLPIVHVCDRPYIECDPDRCIYRERTPRVSTHPLSREEWIHKENLLDEYRSQQTPMRNAFGSDWNSYRRLGVECYGCDLSLSDLRQ